MVRRLNGAAFVADRFSEILELNVVKDWRRDLEELESADELSRGLLLTARRVTSVVQGC